MKKKRNPIWKVISFSFLGILILATAALGYEYYQNTPKGIWNQMFIALIA